MSKKIKILFLDHTPFVGGAQISLLQLVKKIDKNKYEVMIACSKNAEALGLTKEYEKINCKYAFFSFERLKSINPLVIISLVSSVIDIINIIRQEKIDIIFGNTIRADIVGGIGALLTGRKIIWYIQDFTFNRIFFNLLRFIPKKIYYVSKAIACFYGVKLNNKHEVLHIWRDFHEKIKLVSKENIKNKRKKWGVVDGQIVIGYIGRLVEDKGPQTLISAIEDLVNNKKIKNIKCVIIGSGENQEGDNEEYLKKEVKRRKLENNIVFVGFQDDIPTCMLVIDIFCLTTIKPEPFSSVVIEAMMSKVPVIGTDAGGTSEAVKDQVTGLLISPDSPRELSRAILRLINNNDLRIKITNKAYEYVIKHNTVEISLKKIEKTFNTL
ncbi:glycosyltransferase family 4 protein [Candidatus Parcubacteria bacterium]|nr:glycosyltransferase family 4 protein [Candidatus Parcubacteria bacterium]